MDSDKKLPDFLPNEEEMSINHMSFLRFLTCNRNNFSYWFPHVLKLRSKKIRIPVSYIVSVPCDVYKAFFLEKNSDRKKIYEFVSEYVVPILSKHFKGKDVFMKNGCFSNKFDFEKSCHILPTDSAVDLTNKLCELNYNSILCETYGYLELVLREWIEPSPDTKAIYDGMPFRPEMRLFYDFDKKEALYSVNYWDWDYCHDAICDRNPEDKIVYEEDYRKLEDGVRIWGEKHFPIISEALATVNYMSGIWSIDFILEEDCVWLIDMALANTSAYWDKKKAFGDGKG